MLTTEYLRYPADSFVPEYEIGALRAELLTADVAHAALELHTRAYEAHFEDAAMYPLPLPRGTVRRHYDPDNEAKVNERLERMLGYIDQGSQYMYISRVGGRPELTDGGNMPGLAKISPSVSRLGRLRGQQPNLFVNDILVDPRLQQTPQRVGRAAGATLLHAAVTVPDYDPRRSMALHAFTGDSTTDWYERLGLKPVKQVEGETIGGQELPQTLYVSRSGVTIQAVMQALEQRHHQLRNAYVVQANLADEPYED